MISALVQKRWKFGLKLRIEIASVQKRREIEEFWVKLRIMAKEETRRCILDTGKNSDS